MMDVLTNKDGNGVEDTMPTYKVLEEGSMTQTKEELTTMAARQQKFIQGLQAALVRIENIRHLSWHRKANPKRTSARSASCNIKHRSQTCTKVIAFRHITFKW